ncbi:MAG: lysozyme [Candidatus Omnitrophica bacterium]|nr:lysozyme [Candidatus Omnitrophota bacterium]
MEAPSLKSLGLLGSTAIAASLILTFEGYTTTPRLDPVGHTEICWGAKGHIAAANDAVCIRLLKKDLADANSVIDGLVQVPITQGQRGAILDFIYNEGSGRFASSTLLKKLNSRDYAGACKELKKWVYANGKKFNGLERRRDAEIRLCMEGVNVQ